MLAAFRMVDGKQLVFHLRASKFDAGVVLATALAAVAISVEFCIVIGVFLSFVLYVPRAGHSRLVRFTQTADQRLRESRPGDPPCDRLLIYGLEGELFFGAEPELEKQLTSINQAAASNVGAVILVLKQARNPDATFLTLLSTFHARLRSRGIALLLSGVHPDLGKALASTGLDRKIEATRIFPEQPGQDSSIPDALQRAYELLGDHRCLTCPRRLETPGKDQPWEFVI
jgi:SulP family sulfate permease